MAIGDRQPKPAKIEEVAELQEILKAGTLILTDFQGLDVKGISALRRKLREAGSGYRVVKNTLFTRAAVDSPVKPLTEGLMGQTAIVYTDDDPVAAAKVLQDFAKIAKTLRVKCGMVDGNVYGPEQIEALASIPPKQQLYAMVVGGLKSPITGLVGTLQSMMGQLVMTLKAVAEKQAA